MGAGERRGSPLRVRPRNARIVELHRRDGLDLRAIARIVDVSPSTVWRTLQADKLNPGCFINQSPPRARMVWVVRKSEGYDENRNDYAANLTDENRQKQPLQQSETANLVDNPLSPWEEAIREGARRRADESRRRAERERCSWMDRGPPEE